MIPHEKEIVERLRDQPFALIGINSDDGRDAVLKMLKEQEITWRNLLEGSTDGPIATRWNINGWPTVYVIDAQGRIRFRDLRGEELEEAVTNLLKEQKAVSGQ